MHTQIYSKATKKKTYIFKRSLCSYVAKQNEVNCGFVSLQTHTHTQMNTYGLGKIDIPSPFLSYCLINLIDLFSLYRTIHTHEAKKNIEVNTFLIAFEFLFFGFSDSNVKTKKQAFF